MYIEEFKKYLEDKRGMSVLSIQAYMSDLSEFEEECQNAGINDLSKATDSQVSEYLMSLRDKGRTASTINRKLASVRAFYKYLASEGKIDYNPTKELKTSRLDRRNVEYLTIEEVELILDVPNNTLKGKRDKALLELLYATGIRVNELIAADVADVNTKIGFFTCRGAGGKARIVPIGAPAREAMDIYLEEARDMFVKSNKLQEALFVNSNGGRITRQGLWKILKTYGKKVGLEEKLTPHILRTSFGVHMVQNGADLKSLQELLGHEDATATQIYLYVTKNRIKDVYDKTHPRA